jgi:hypothetical protein
MEEQHGIKTTFTIEIKTSNSRIRRIAATATYAGQLSKRKVKRIVFCA